MQSSWGCSKLLQTYIHYHERDWTLRNGQFFYIALHRKPLQAPAFCGKCDQVSLWTFLYSYHIRFISTFSIMLQKRQNIAKTSNQVGGGTTTTKKKNTEKGEEEEEKSTGVQQVIIVVVKVWSVNSRVNVFSSSFLQHTTSTHSPFSP